MRRKELEITDRAAIDDILARAQVCRVAMADGGQPYVVPLNFGYDGRALYLHCAKEGRKLEILRKNPLVCFEVDIDHKLVIGDKACARTMKYSSVIGFGRAEILEPGGEKKKGLELLLDHYGGSDAPLADKMVDAVEVIRIDIESLTGKTKYR